jgi:hypothetical protein
MPYIPIWERIGIAMGKEEGLLRGIEVGLKIKFGAESLELMPELRELHDNVMLVKILDAIETAASPEELRPVWTRKRRSKKRGQTEQNPE